MTQPSVLVIVVNWNTRDLLRQTLQSLRDAHQFASFTAVVVDNASTDGSADMVDAEFPECRLLRSETNLGFSKANNAAIRAYPDYEYYLLLNSDATVTPDVITGLLDYAVAHPRVAAVGPALKLPTGEYQTGGAGWGPGARHALATYLLLARLSRRFRGLYILQEQYADSPSPVLVDWLAGACMLVPKRAFSEIGLLSERYFVYGEDAEWCWRARNAGWEIAYLPYLVATHFYRGSSDTGVPTRPDWFRNLSDAVRVSGSGPNYRMFLVWSVIGYFLRTVVSAPFSARGRQATQPRAREYASLLRESYRLLTH